MVNLRLTACAAMFTLCAIPYASAQPPLDAVKRAKQATAFVEVEEADGIAEGTAFCIDPVGLFITNAHVVKDQKPGGRIMLVIRSGDDDQVKTPANVLKIDESKDLAILQAAHPGKVSSLNIGSDDGLVETTPVVAFGYPFGKDLALKEGDFPSITVSTGHVTALRKLEGDLASIQLDASLNEGNSGGPVIGPNGDVIAIVMEGIPGSGINMAIPITYLKSFMNSLTISFTPPVPKPGHPKAKLEFKVQLLAPPKGTAKASVEVTLTSKEDGTRNFILNSEDGKIYTAQIGLLSTEATKTPSSINYKIAVVSAGKVIASDDGKIGLDDAAEETAAVGGAAPATRRFGRELIVSCLDSNDIRRFDAQTGQYLGTFAIGNGIQGPQDIQWGPGNIVYVCSAYTHSIRRFNGTTGEFLGAFVPDKSGGLNDAIGLAFGADGNLYVCSYWSSEVKEYSGKNGEFLGNFVTKGSGGLDRACFGRFRSGMIWQLYVYENNNNNLHAA